MTVDIGAVERRLSGKPARLGVLMRVKNECDVIEAFVRHHVALVDHVVVVDNASQDGTRTILDLLVQEGLPLTVVDDPTLEYRQSEIMSYLARALFRTHGFDRLFLLDADEFLIAAGRPEIDAALKPFRTDETVRLAWVTYVPDAKGPKRSSLLRCIVRRRASEITPEYKVALAPSFAESPSQGVAQGNHSIVSDGEIVETPISTLRIGHFPVRSIAQLMTKAAVAWTSYVAMGYDGAYGAQWRSLANRQYSEIGAVLRDIAFAYPGEPIPVDEDALMLDPIPHTWKTRYSKLAVPEPLRTIAKFAEQVARRYAEVSAELDRIAKKEPARR